MRRGSAIGGAGAALIVVACAATLLLGYLNKARCAGAPFDAVGRSLIFEQTKDSHVCYSDIQFLWLYRGVDQHLFPYVDGALTPDGVLTGGAIEYPVLSGLLMWLGAIGVHTDADYLRQSALLLAPFALFTAWMLARLAGRAALLWAIGTPLVLYAFHNWELPVVCTAVAAVFVVVAGTRMNMRTRCVLAAVLLGIGFCLKLYPGLFVVPLLLFTLTRGSVGSGDRESPPTARGRYDVRGAIAVTVAAAVPVILINLPFAILGFQGWLASFTFQQEREADITTNSIWFWGLRPLFASGSAGESAFQHAVSIASPALVLASCALAVWLGWRRWSANPGDGYPWVAVSAAMLCGFVLFHKVHSPQYTLWLLPFFVLLTVPWRAVSAFLVADAALGIGVFRYFHDLSSGNSAAVSETLVRFGVWGQASLLVGFFVFFLRADLRGPRPVAVGPTATVTPATAAR